jgi:hypothetical protein
MRAGGYSVMTIPLLILCAAVGTSRGPDLKPSVHTLDLYSARARRRAAALLRLEYLELGRRRLERIRSVIRHRLPVDDLLREAS